MKIIGKAKQLFHQVILEGFILYLILINPKCPWYARLFVLIPIAYVFSPVDLIPDVIPIMGQLDDLAVVRYTYVLLLKIVPKSILEECREKAQIKLSPENRRSFETSAIIVSILIFLGIFGAIYMIKKLRGRK
jgi:uncharacterized membrane protein YkvA (DUF1232 family)